jgi:acetyl esterase/lipase
MQKFYDAFLPGWDVDSRKDPRVSPLYVDLEAFRSLPGDEKSRVQFGDGVSREEDGSEHVEGAGGRAKEYAKSRLPRALFTCGTIDPLLDDSVAMAMKWAMGGGEQVLKIYPGAVHGFIGFDRGVVEEAAECLGDTAVFISDAMEGVEEVEVEEERREKGGRGMDKL